jgi:uncharacterized protein (TIGR02145 family)
MKVKLNFLKIVICNLLILPVSSMVSLQAQDYYISFAGTGESTTVDSVIIENLTQGTKLKMNGSDVLHLVAVVTGIETIGDDRKDRISFYPNPMKDHARMQFALPEKGESVIALYDLSGRKIAQTRDLLSEGRHTYGIQGIEEGIYFVRIRSGKYSLSGKLICSGSQNRGPKIVYENTLAVQEKQSDSKGTNVETEMQYTIGDRLKFTGISDNYITVVTDTPSIPGEFHISFDFNPCTDGDGNNYSTVRIGSQIWMGENLKTTKYSNKSDIPNVTDNTEWGGLTDRAYCWYNNEIRNKNIYGALYNWYAATDSGFCPSGWHLPVNTEWIRLSDYLGGLDDAGNKLKENSATFWISPNTGATNETGFTALPGGERDPYDGTFIFLRAFGLWWSYTPYAGNTTNNVRLFYTDSGLRFGSSNKSFGFSVRCLKDYHLKDIDGNPYTTVKIGNQVWMVENLKTTRLNDGTLIPSVTDSNEWSLLTAAGYCWWNNDTAKSTYGALYNWYTVNTGKLCPTGWHVPTNTEWVKLSDYLGGPFIAGGKLKETLTTHWASPNTGATNESGFTALPGGYRYGTGGFESNLGCDVYWWSATEANMFQGHALSLSCTSSSVIFYSYIAKSYGYSVRCVKDE